MCIYKERENQENEIVHKTNNERFNEIINAARNPRKVYNALMPVKPSIKQANQVCEESEIIIRKIFSGLNVS